MPITEHITSGDQIGSRGLYVEHGYWDLGMVVGPPPVTTPVVDHAQPAAAITEH